MKEGWTYKKLGDVCKVLNGLWVGKKEPFINIAVIRNTNFSKECKLNLDDVAHIDVEERQFATRKLQVGDIIIEKSGGSDKQPVGRPILFNIPNGDFSFSNFTAALRLTDNSINPHFLHYCLYGHYRNGETKRMQSKTTGLRNLDMKAYLRLPIPFFCVAEQERIVAELDLLSSIVEKKKAQLKELDQLAQSIFYTMFGDPITNEKGWEVKKLGEVCLLKAGKAIRAAELKEKTDNTFPCYGGNGIRGYINKVSHKKDLPIIGRQGALCGNVNYAKAPFYATEHAVVVTPLIEMDIKWLYNELKLLQLEQYAHGVAQPGIAVSDLIPISFPLPPLPLQQEFADKVEAIERQKTLIQQSIDEVQTLFDSRMDYWFG